MGPSPALVSVGLRTAPRAGWRTAATNAISTVLGTPALWLIGALGFLLRGGIVLLTLAVVVLPSPVAVRLLIGDNLGTGGFAGGFVLMVALVAALLAGVALVGVWLASYAEVLAFEAFTGQRALRRRRLTGAVFTIDLVVLAALVTASLPLILRAIEVTYAELLVPSAIAGSLYERVAGQLGGQLLLVLAVLVLLEAASAAAKRRLMRGALGLHPPISPLDALLVGLGRPVVRPLPTLGTAALAWLTSAVVLLPALWAIGLTWQVARAALLDPRAAAQGYGPGIAALAIVALCACWLGAVALAGVSSAIRAGLWSAEEARGRPSIEC